MLSVSRQGELLTLSFPAQTPKACETPEELIQGLGIRPLECLSNEDYIAVLASEEDVANLDPKHELLKKLALRGVAVTAKSSKYDFVARFFAPKYGIDEDSVTGSIYTQLTPYWAAKLGKSTLKARQLSARGGDLLCTLSEERVLISGSAVKYLEGTIEIPT